MKTRTYESDGTTTMYNVTALISAVSRLVDWRLASTDRAPRFNLEYPVHTVTLLEGGAIVGVGVSQESWDEAIDAALDGIGWARRETIPSPPPVPMCPECDGSGGGWDGNPDNPAWECEKCNGSGVDKCDGCGDPAVTHDDSHPSMPVCQTCLDLCHECGARPHTIREPGGRQWCEECWRGIPTCDWPAYDYETQVERWER